MTAPPPTVATTRHRRARGSRVWRAQNEIALQVKRAHPDDVLLVSLQQLLAAERAIRHCRLAWGLDLADAPIAEVRDDDLLRSRGSAMGRLAARLVRAEELERELAAGALEQGQR